MKESSELPGVGKFEIYTLEGKSGIRARISELGACVLSLEVKDCNGLMRDVVLGHGDMKGYLDNGSAHGAVVGRVANRIGGCSYTLNGKKYTLENNDSGNTLHGGFTRWFEKKWETVESGENFIVLKYESPDMEQGFPGNMSVTVRYDLTENNSLKITYNAVSDKDTLFNITNHTYFNLSGNLEKSIRNHKLQIESDTFTPTDAHLIPTGELRKVFGTPLDFTALKEIGRDIESNYEPIVLAGGYDHNFALGDDGEFKKAARLICPETGISVTVYTDMPGIQVYTGNYLNDEGKGGIHYGRNAGVALETQFFPDAINHAGFKQPVLKAGEKFASCTEYIFESSNIR